jgi:hypothetical protein
VRVLRDARQRLEDVMQLPRGSTGHGRGKHLRAGSLRAGSDPTSWCGRQTWLSVAISSSRRKSTTRSAGLGEGASLLLHERVEPGPDGSRVNPTVHRAALTTALLERLRARGLSAATVSELTRLGAVRTAWFRHRSTALDQALRPQDRSQGAE